MGIRQGTKVIGSCLAGTKSCRILSKNQVPIAEYLHQDDAVAIPSPPPTTEYNNILEKLKRTEESNGGDPPKKRLASVDLRKLHRMTEGFHDSFKEDLSRCCKNMLRGKEGMVENVMELVDMSTFSVASQKSFFNRIKATAQENTMGLHIRRQMIVFFCYYNGEDEHMTVIDICENVITGRALEDKQARILKSFPSEELKNIYLIETELPTHTDFLKYLLYREYVTQSDLEKMKQEGRVFDKDGREHEDKDDDAEYVNEGEEEEEIRTGGPWGYSPCTVWGYTRDKTKILIKRPKHCPIINLNRLREDLTAPLEQSQHYGRLVREKLDFVEAFQAMILYVSYHTVNRIRDYFKTLPNNASTRQVFMFWDAVRNPLKMNGDSMKDYQRTCRKKREETKAHKEGMSALDVELQLIESRLPRITFQIMVSVLMNCMRNLTSHTLGANELFSMEVNYTEAELSCVFFAFRVLGEHLPAHNNVNRCQDLHFLHYVKNDNRPPTVHRPSWREIVDNLKIRYGQTGIPFQINVYSTDTDIFPALLIVNDNAKVRRAMNGIPESSTSLSSMVSSFHYFLVMLNRSSSSKERILNVDIETMFREVKVDGLGNFIMIVCGNDFQRGSLCTIQSSMENFDYTVDEVRVFTHHYCVCVEGWKRLPEIVKQVRHSTLDAIHHRYMTCTACRKIQHPGFWRMKLLVAAASKRPLCNADLFRSFISSDRGCLPENPQDRFDEASSLLVQPMILMEDMTLLNGVTNCASYVLLGCLNGELFKKRWTTKKLKLSKKYKVAEETVINPLLLAFTRRSVGEKEEEEDEHKQAAPPPSQVGFDDDDDVCMSRACDEFERGNPGMEIRHRTMLFEQLIKNSTKPSTGRESLHSMIDSIDCIHQYMLGYNLCRNVDSIPILHYRTQTIRSVANEAARYLLEYCFMDDLVQYCQGVAEVNKKRKRLLETPFVHNEGEQDLLSRIHRFLHTHFDGPHPFTKNLLDIFEQTSSVPTLTLLGGLASHNEEN